MSSVGIVERSILGFTIEFSAVAIPFYYILLRIIPLVMEKGWIVAYD